jgi:hypothetical protein
MEHKNREIIKNGMKEDRHKNTTLLGCDPAACIWVSLLPEVSLLPALGQLNTYMWVCLLPAFGKPATYRKVSLLSGFGSVY